LQFTSSEFILVPVKSGKRVKANSKCRQSGCPVAFSLDIFGDKWTLLVIRDLALLGKRHYGEFLDSPEGIATNILADRLCRLEQEEIVSKAPDPANQTKYIYALTDKGLGLLPVLLEMAVWGAEHDPDTAAPKQFIQQIRKDRDAVIAGITAQLKERKK
jgi:DNA-binding HxlR family transcriptional regulator